jgi:hypothetical protein
LGLAAALVVATLTACSTSLAAVPEPSARDIVVARQMGVPADGLEAMSAGAWPAGVDCDLLRAAERAMDYVASAHDLTTEAVAAVKASDGRFVVSLRLTQGENAGEVLSCELVHGTWRDDLGSLLGHGE